jgi:predicted transcriptional regulator
MSTLTIAQIMSTPLFVISSKTRCAEVLAQAQAKHIHHFPIVDQGQLVGFVCTCDLAHADAQEPVTRHAWRHPATVSPRCPASVAARLLLLHGVGTLIIADQNGFHGIVTCEDLRRAGPELEALLESARCMKCGAGWHLRPGPDGAPICMQCKLAERRAAAAHP